MLAATFVGPQMSLSVQNALDLEKWIKEDLIEWPGDNPSENGFKRNFDLEARIASAYSAYPPLMSYLNNKEVKYYIENINHIYPSIDPAWAERFFTHRHRIPIEPNNHVY